MVRGCGSGGDESTEDRPSQQPQLATSRKGSRPQHHQRSNNNPPSHKPHGGGSGGGGYTRAPWRHTDQVGDSRQWSENHNNGGGRGGSRGRGRSGGGGGSRGIHHHSARIIPDHKDFNSVIENGCGGKGSGNKHIGDRYNNEVLMGSGAGGGRKGPKGNRQRYGGGRGRGHGPPQPLTPSSLHNSAQDWS